jgi:hypothetical protein
MSHKAVWIAFWMTMMYWLGGAVGCTQSQPWAVDADTPPGQPTAAGDEAVAGEPEAAVQDAADQQAWVQDSETPDADEESMSSMPQTSFANEWDGANTPSKTSPALGMTATPPHTAMQENQPSLHGLDRSHWPKIRVGPDDGSTPHGPIVFKDVQTIEHPKDAQQPLIRLDLAEIKLPAEDFSRVLENADTNEKQIIDAMKNAKPENWSGANGLEAIVQPLKVTVDLATSPIRHAQDKAALEASTPKATETVPDIKEPTPLQ